MHGTAVAVGPYGPGSVGAGYDFIYVELGFGCDEDPLCSRVLLFATVDLNAAACGLQYFVLAGGNINRLAMR